MAAVGSHLDRLNDNLSRGLHLGHGGARGPERSQPSLTDVFESARTGSLPMPAPEDDDDSAYSDVPARCTRCFNGWVAICQFHFAGSANCLHGSHNPVTRMPAVTVRRSSLRQQ